MAVEPQIPPLVGLRKVGDFIETVFLWESHRTKIGTGILGSAVNRVAILGGLTGKQYDNHELRSTTKSSIPIPWVSYHFQDNAQIPADLVFTHQS